MNKKRLCLQCDDGTALVHGARDLTMEYKGRALMVSAVRGWHCPVCGECEFDASEGERYGAEMDAFSAGVDKEISAALRATRKKLGLRQAEAGKLFGGGISAFSEYERGKTQPHKSTVLLLKLLDRPPELLDEIRAA